MRAVTISHPGDPSVLGWGETELPTPTPTDVVIRVAAAGINNADLLQRQGHYPVPAGASPILGLEVSGEISWVGADVSGWSVGDRVCALLSGGGYAEEVVVPGDMLLPVPTGVDLIEAAGLPEAAGTVYSNLAMNARLGDGMTLLVHGGASGIGTFAIQWAKAIGATVVTTAGSARKLDRVSALGADTLVNYREQDFVAETLAATGGRGAEVILDIVGADYLDRNIRALAPDGHLVVIGSTGGSPDAPLNIGLLMSKRGSVTSTSLRSRPHTQKAAIIREVRQNVWPLIEAGRIVPVIDSIFSMADASEGHRLLAAGGAVGKVLLTP
ncbi:NAD(P)H-quinone oxidoreductase [Glaciihabitans sp. dw_435]|uniref:NAD(P)H-quinone oxidoreductase n=1 Tax=Glaciihabitans sp. dw_435 TaxID=2720081 RepID=UPI001BD4A82E|nr:NAD(P)H-quinone oxidoreductase [Glaciihabitans sp. dw_435]